MISYENEIWMPVPGTKYRASNFGRIKGPRKILKEKKTWNGYRTVTVLYGKKPKEKKIHRLVAQAFFKHYSERLQVNHMDGDKTNNMLNNLEMVTPLENMRHGIATGLIDNRGENCKTSVLDNGKVLTIRGLFERGASKNSLSKMYGVTRKTIRDIVERKTWSHI